MAAPTQEPGPTQEFPPWLSPTVITTDVGGVETTQTLIVQMPLTYFGPSIPLGPGWVFGGSTFPASIGFGPPSTTESESSTSSSSASESTSTSTSSSTSSSTTPSITPLPSSTPSPTSSPSQTTPKSASPTSTASAALARSHGPPLATILGATLSVVVVLALALAFFFCFLRRRRRRSNRGSAMSDNWEHIEHPTALSGSGSGSGNRDVEAGQAEEGDAFLADSNMRERGGLMGLLAHPWRRSQPARAIQPTSTTTGTVSTGGTGGTSGTGGTGGSGENGGTGNLSSGTNASSSDPIEAAALYNGSGSTVAASSLFFNPARADETGVLRRSTEDPAPTQDEPIMTLRNVPRGSGSNLDIPNPHDTESQRSSVPLPLPAGAAVPWWESPLRPQRSVERPGGLTHMPSLSDPALAFIPPGTSPERQAEIARNRSKATARARASYISSSNVSVDLEERAALLTAQRVNAGTPRRAIISNVGSGEKSVDDEEKYEETDEASSSPAPTSRFGSGIVGITKGLGRFSWFRRMEAVAGVAGPSGTRRSTASSNRRSAGNGSRPGSGAFNFRPATRPSSALLHPGFGSRPASGYSFLGIDPELGMRPPGMRMSAASAASGNASSAKSGQTIYHDARETPQDSLRSDESRLVDAPEMPDVDIADQTIRTVDVLDLPAPETTLPLVQPLIPDSPSGGSRTSSMASRGTALRFPPGLVNVQSWDGGSRSTGSNQLSETYEDAPPRAGGEWNRMRIQQVVAEGGDGQGHEPRDSSGQHPVQLTVTDNHTSELGSIVVLTETSEPGQDLIMPTPRSPAVLGFSLTPRVSRYASDDHLSHNSGSHSSRPSHHSQHTSHSQGLSHSSSRDSEQGYLPELPELPQGPGINRASLSAVGGNLGATGAPQLPPLKRVSALQPPVSPIEERRETETLSTSRPGTGDMTVLTRTETFASGSASLSTVAPTLFSRAETPEKS